MKIKAGLLSLALLGVIVLGALVPVSTAQASLQLTESVPEPISNL